MTNLLNCQINFFRQPDQAYMPGAPLYEFGGYPADPTLQIPPNEVNFGYAIASPPDPSMGIFATLAAAQADFIANQLPTLIPIINANYPGTPAYTGIGIISVFNEGSKSNTTVVRTIGGAGTQCSNPNNDNLVILSLTEAQTLSLTTGQSGTLSFQTAPPGGSYTEYSRIGNGNSGTLTIGIGLTNTGTGLLIGFVPATYSYKIVPAGSGANTYITGQELSF